MEKNLSVQVTRGSKIYNDRGMVAITEDIDSCMMKDFEEDILMCMEAGFKEIILIFSSPGGEVLAGLAFMRTIKKYQRQGIKFTGLVQGFAMSMAFLVLQVCDTRVMGRNDVLMCHGASGLSLGAAQDLKAEVKLMDKFQNDFAKLIADRNTSDDEIYHQQAFWIDILDQATPQYYDSKESLEMGIIDKVEDQNGYI